MEPKSELFNSKLQTEIGMYSRKKEVFVLRFLYSLLGTLRAWCSIQYHDKHEDSVSLEL